MSAQCLKNGRFWDKTWFLRTLHFFGGGLGAASPPPDPHYWGGAEGPKAPPHLPNCKADAAKRNLVLELKALETTVGQIIHLSYLEKAANCGTTCVLDLHAQLLQRSDN